MSCCAFFRTCRDLASSVLRFPWLETYRRFTSDFCWLEFLRAIWPIFLGLGVVTLVLVAPLLGNLMAYLPDCGMRLLLGLPCPLCGGTRSFLALSQGLLTRAFLFNPLVAVVGLFVGLFSLLSLFHPGLGGALVRSLLGLLRSPRFLPYLLLLVLAHWLFLCFFLPP